MSASPADVGRTISRSERMQAIYEVLARIEGTQRRHDNRFAEIGIDLTDLRSQVSDLRADVTTLNTKVASLDEKVTSLDEKVTSIDTKLDRVIGLLER